MRVVPVSFRQAGAFVATHHRHHKPAKGHKFSIGLEDGGVLVGVACVGRPLSRIYDQQGTIAEVLRLCTDGSKNACSMLYAACARAAFAMGYQKIITYTLEEENGASLKASGFILEAITDGKGWSRVGRERVDDQPIGPKKRWARTA